MVYDIVPSPEVHIELGILIAALQDGTREWLGELGEPSVEALTWQPFPNGPSIGGCILHIAATEAAWLTPFAKNVERDETNPAYIYNQELDVDAVQWPTPPARPFAWYLDLLELQRAESIAMIAAHNDPAKKHLRDDGSGYCYRWIVGHLVQHDSYHGGQATLLHEYWKKTTQ
jgi:uncharacterized damage-inducible protein DinB